MKSTNSNSHFVDVHRPILNDAMTPKSLIILFYILMSLTRRRMDSQNTPNANSNIYLYISQRHKIQFVITNTLIIIIINEMACDCNTRFFRISFFFFVFTYCVHLLNVVH